MGSISAHDLEKLFNAKMKLSGLTPLDARKLGFKTVNSAQSATLGVPAFAGFVIPYHHTDGRKSEFYRVRYLESTKGTGFASLTEQKEIRYTQPKNTVSEVYLPPTKDWNKFLASDERLIITEGELKAAAACKAGFACIALGGVWSFQSSKQNIPLLPWFTLNEEALADREIIIAFDSDAATNPQVVMAENRLARRLLELGARVAILRMPTLESNGQPIKTGIDDFLVLKSAEDFRALLTTASEYEDAKELHQLNEEVCYVRDPGLIVRLENFQRLSHSDFTNHAFSTRNYFVQVTMGKTVKMMEKSAPKEWLKWRYRFEVRKIAYAPEGQLITEDGELNIWKGYGHDGKLQPIKGDMSMWEEFLDYMFSGSAENRDWFCKWLAYPVQHPGTKMATAVVIWGLAQGTGKTMLGLLPGCVYGKNFTQISEDDLYGSFNDWADGKQFVLGDEITSGNKRGVADRLRGMITRTTLRINQKYVPPYEVPDIVNYFFTSNHPDAFIMENEDRRMFIHRAPQDKMSEEFYARLADRYLRTVEGQAAMLYWLKSYPTGDFNPHAPAPYTLEKQNMIILSRTDAGDWVNTLREDPDAVMRIGDKVLDWSLASSEELRVLYDPQGMKKLTANGMARELSRAGFAQAYNGKPIRCGGDGIQRRLWLVRHWDKLHNAEVSSLAELYNSERNIGTEKVKPKKVKF